MGAVNTSAFVSGAEQSNGFKARVTKGLETRWERRGGGAGIWLEDSERGAICTCLINAPSRLVLDNV